MKNYALILLLFYTTLVSAQVNNVVVNGKTNVNTFKCVNSKFNQLSNSYSFRKNQLPHLQLEVNNFDCGHKIMTADMKQTLKADRFPKMYVKFLSFNPVNDKQYNAKIEVKLTDKTRYYNTSFYVVKNTLVGKENVRFSDFGIKAPTKMGGIIAVEDTLSLVLTLNNY